MENRNIFSCESHREDVPSQQSSPYIEFLLPMTPTSWRRWDELCVFKKKVRQTTWTNMTWQRQIWVIRVEEDIILSHQKRVALRRATVEYAPEWKRRGGERKVWRTTSYFNSIKKSSWRIHVTWKTFFIKTFLIPSILSLTRCISTVDCFWCCRERKWILHRRQFVATWSGCDEQERGGEKNLGNDREKTHRKKK